MRVAKVVGQVTLNRCHPGFEGAHLTLLVPLLTRDLLGDGEPTDEPIVAWDQLNAGIGGLVAVAEGSEAAHPFLPEIKPLDAYVAAILDQLEVDHVLVREVLGVENGESGVGSRESE